MNRFVLDASVVLTWCFPDEQSRKAEIVAQQIAYGDVPIVTAFWAHEVLNALLMGERRKRITPQLTQNFLQELQHMPVVISSATSVEVFEAVQGLCRKHGLTSYDAAYLQAAISGGYPLATVDDALIRAAQAENISLL